MMKGRPKLRPALAILLLVGLLPSFVSRQPATASTDASSIAQEPVQAGKAIKDNYIVVLRDDGIGAAAVTASLKASHKLKVKREFTHAFNGFSAEMPAGEAEKLKNDPRVALVEPDRLIYLPEASLGESVDRVNAELNPCAKVNSQVDPSPNIDIAIIDSGVASNPLLNIAGGYDCTGSGTYHDERGHGTFVTGLAAAKDNSSGHSGIAPGARIWSVKVINSNWVPDSFIVCGVDWVTAHARTIEVANMSLAWYDADPEPTCDSSALHWAICSATNAGVTISVAAGNASWNSVQIAPGKYPEVITVSAMVDTDGGPGGLGPPATGTQGKDDAMASFSNYGATIDIAAPGVDVVSFDETGAFGPSSGTSFSAPLVAGAAAMYIIEHGRGGPFAVKAGLLAMRERVHLAGDRDGIDEGVLNASGRPYPASITLSRVSAQVDQNVSIDLDKYPTGEGVTVKFDSAVVQSAMVVSGDVTFRVPAAVKGDHVVTAVSHTYAIQRTLHISPRIKFLPSSGIPGSGFKVSLRGFSPHQQVAIKWYNGTALLLTLGSIVTTSTGSANMSYDVPTTYRGGHMIEADPASGGSVTASFAVKPWVTLIPASGASGATVALELKGFMVRETVKVYLLTGATKKLLRIKTIAANGSATSTVTVPLMSATLGGHVVTAEGSLGSFATTTFEVTSFGTATTPFPTGTAIPTPSPTTGFTETPAHSPTIEFTATPSAATTAVPTGIPTGIASGTPLPTETSTETPTVTQTATRTATSSP
ncbi:MAG: S8 family serine peptidase [Thermomicrobiales bacterium]